MLSGESVKLLEEMEGYQLLVHEFLYLVVNAQDRLQHIEENHKVLRSPRKLAIQQWELCNATSKPVCHIFKLDNNAFVNQAPHHLVTESLNRLTSDKQFKIQGGDRTSSGQVRETYTGVYSKMWKQIKYPADKHEQKNYRQKVIDIETHLRENDQFIQQNYDRSKYTSQKLR